MRLFEACQLLFNWHGRGKGMGGGGGHTVAELGGNLEGMGRGQR